MEFRILGSIEARVDGAPVALRGTKPRALLARLLIDAGRAVPVLDMLRNELTPNGAFVMAEFGSVRDPEQFRVLYAYSPYHNVEDGTAYPPVLFTAGEFDPRVEVKSRDVV